MSKALLDKLLTYGGVSADDNSQLPAELVHVARPERGQAERALIQQFDQPSSSSDSELVLAYALGLTDLWGVNIRYANLLAVQPKGVAVYHTILPGPLASPELSLDWLPSVPGTVGDRKNGRSCRKSWDRVLLRPPKGKEQRAAEQRSADYQRQG